MKCFEYNKESKTNCGKKTCRYWIDQGNYQNCCLIASKNTLPSEHSDKFTLQDIGNIFKVTRMRICQIEKKALSKVKEVFLK